MAEQKFTPDELRTHIADVTDKIKQLATEYEGREFSTDAHAEFEALKDERSKSQSFLSELEARESFLSQISDRPDNVENERTYQFQTRKASNVPDDPTNLEEYRTRSRSIEELDRAYQDGAKYLLEKRWKPADGRVRSVEDAQADVERLIDKDREVAMRMIYTSRPGYKNEWAKYIQTGQVGPELARAASLTTTAGGYAVPVELDPTLLLTNAGVVNPIRQISRVRTTNVNTYEFINTTGVTAAYSAEATEASDNAPTLAQPTVNLEKAQAFVPMSIEISQDWAAIQEDLAMCFNDAKNQLESTKFLTGLGHASNEPQGLIAVGGATAVVSSATTAVFAVADLYSLELALGARYRQNASIVGNKAAFQKVRQFDTAGGANLWVQLQGGNPAELIGYKAYEWSGYSSATTTSGSTILTIGDFNYFGIVDRAGMNVEFIPHLFGSGSRFPTGQRGIYCWWRNSTKVLSSTVSASSAFQSLKLL